METVEINAFNVVNPRFNSYVPMQDKYLIGVPFTFLAGIASIVTISFNLNIKGVIIGEKTKDGCFKMTYSKCPK